MNPIRWLPLLLVALVGCVSERPLVHTGDLRRVAVAATASSSEGGHAAGYAFDGDKRTRWSSEFRDGQWLQVELAATCELTGLRLSWEDAYARTYRVESSLDGERWTTLFATDDGKGGRETIPLAAPVRLRYLRLDCDRRATEWGNSLWEVEMEGRSPLPLVEGGGLIAFAEKRDLSPAEQAIKALHDRLTAQAAADPPTADGLSDTALLRLVQRRAFDYFWYESDPETGLVPDFTSNYEPTYRRGVASIANSGYYLSMLPIAIEQGWVDRAEAERRARNLLLTARDRLPHEHGFYYHFMETDTLQRAWECELSSIDSALFFYGVATAVVYWRDTGLAAIGWDILDRADWQWMLNGGEHLSMGWKPEDGFLPYTWGGMNEGIMVYPLAIGSRTHPIPAAAWQTLRRERGTYGGHTFYVEAFQSIFRYQYPLLWLDLKGKTDGHADYAADAREAVLACRQYCIDRAGQGYGPNTWGLGAAQDVDNHYRIFGFGPGEPLAPADGTVIPYAVAGSVFLAPEESIAGLRHLYTAGHYAWGKYGLPDSLRLRDRTRCDNVLGLDQGTIVLGIENYLTGRPQAWAMQNPMIATGLRRMGFK